MPMLPGLIQSYGPTLLGPIFLTFCLDQPFAELGPSTITGLIGWGNLDKVVGLHFAIRRVGLGIQAPDG